MKHRLHLDFEVYSEVDIKKAGAYRYAEDPSTEVLMASYAFNDGKVKLWDAKSSPTIPKELDKRLRDENYAIHAFNAPFERLILKHVLGYDIPTERFRCTLAHSYFMGFAGGLDQVAKAVGLPEDKQKLDTGRRLIQRFCKPTPKNHIARRYDKESHPEEWEQFKEYCIQDTITEREVYYYLRSTPMSDFELDTWFLDQRINDRGLPIDTLLVNNALELANEEKHNVIRRMRDITGLDNPNSGPQLLPWLQDNGVQIDNLQAATIEAILLEELDDASRTILEMKQSISKSSVSKYSKMLECLTSDGTVKGTLQFMGASRTGRWAGRLIQPQNFSRPELKDTECVDFIHNGINVDDGKTMTRLSSALRSAIASPDKRVLSVSDLAGIEGRVLPWLCGFTEKLDKIRGGLDMYKVAASTIYHVPYSQIDKTQRFTGKVAELALGYQGAVGALNQMGAAYGVEFEEEEAKQIVRGWRLGNKPIVDFWYAVQDAAMLAIQHPDYEYYAGKLTFYVEGDYLFVVLPSGRRLSYHKPELVNGSITYMGWNSYTRKWQRIETYGGKLCVAKDTPVLTKKGWVSIQDVKRGEEVWDGIAWVSCDGAVNNGTKEVIEAHGVLMTPDHEILTREGWKRASQSKGYNRVTSRLPYGSEIRWKQWEEIPVVSQVRLWGTGADASNRTHETEKEGSYRFVRVQAQADDSFTVGNTWNEQASGIRRMEINARSVQSAVASGVEKLRRSWNKCLQALGCVREFLGGYERHIPAWAHAGQDRQFKGLLTEELPLGELYHSSEQPQMQPPNRHTSRENDGIRSEQSIKREIHDAAVSGSQQLPYRSSIRQTGYQKPVYDLVNCGPRNRFVVRDRDGFPLIVHNCENTTQAVSRDILAENMHRIEEYGFTTIGSVHDEVLTLNKPFKKYDSEHLSALLATNPTWAPDLPLAAEGYTARRYKK